MVSPLRGGLIKIQMNNSSVIQSRCRYYCDSLARIPIAFGFDHIDARAIITSCYNSVDENSSRGDLSAFLTKVVVKECIRRLSIFYFNNASDTKRVKMACLDYSFNGSARTDMPLPYKAAYILQKQGFHKTQIAEFLNTTVVTISQHLALAQQYMANAA
jgi:hypothetical protein